MRERGKREISETGNSAGRLFRTSEPQSFRTTEPQKSEVGGQKAEGRIANCEFGIWDVLTFTERRAIRKILNLPYALCPMPHAELSWLLTTGSSSLYDFYDLNDLNDLNRSLLTAYCLLITWLLIVRYSAPDIVVSSPTAERTLKYDISVSMEWVPQI